MEIPTQPNEVWKDGTQQLTAGIDPVMIGDTISDGIDLGFGLTEKRRALREYYREQFARDHGPPAYDTEEIWEGDELIGLRVSVSEPACRFYMDNVDDELLVRMSEGDDATIPLGFTCTARSSRLKTPSVSVRSSFVPSLATTRSMRWTDPDCPRKHGR